MKLRNKKTGEIGSLKPYGGEDGRIWVWIDNMSRPEYRYNSLVELNEEWEDYEGPKHEYYFLRDGGNIDCHWYQKLGEITERRKEVGNYFESKEEAEKAVKKIKAFTKLKDNGFKFETYNFDRHMITNGRANLFIKASFNAIYDNNGVKLSDLDLLFGGGE